MKVARSRRQRLEWEKKLLESPPVGSYESIRSWMRDNLKFRLGLGDEPKTATQFAEEAAYAFGYVEWLEDSNHVVWDAAVDVMEENGL